MLAFLWPRIDSKAEAEILGKLRVQRTCVGGRDGDCGGPILSPRLRLRVVGDVTRDEGGSRRIGGSEADSSAVVSPVSSSPRGRGVATSCLTWLSSESSSA